MADPTNVFAMDDIKFHDRLQRRAGPWPSESALEEAIDRY